MLPLDVAVVLVGTLDAGVVAGVEDVVVSAEDCAWVAEVLAAAGVGRRPARTVLLVVLYDGEVAFDAFYSFETVTWHFAFHR